ncbi:hypothetical protein EDD16DRAFT_1494523, partial [Pisolithus croceorrhizus]
QKLLEPLAFASTITQMAHFRVDQSLLLMVFLYAEYSKLLEADPENQLFAAMECEELIQAVLDSLEKHWKNCDQDVYIAAVVLNPVYKTAPFAKISQLNLAGIFALICKLWTRFFGSSPPHELFMELQDYLGNKGTYMNFAAWVENVQCEAEKKHPDPLAMYEGMQYGGGEKTPLQKVAFRLFANCANSVSCECLFSMFGLTLTCLHSRLRSEAMTSLAELWLHLQDEHAQSGQAKHRLKLRATTYIFNWARSATCRLSYFSGWNKFHLFGTTTAAIVNPSKPS